LGNGIQARLWAIGAAQWGAIVKVGANVPLPVPGGLFGGRRVDSGPLSQLARPGRVTTRFQNRGPLAEYIDQEPCQPYALSLAPMAHAVQAIVPITGADERQAVWPTCAAPLDGAEAVL